MKLQIENICHNTVSDQWSWFVEPEQWRLNWLLIEWHTAEATGKYM